jgi:hypothetical protein
MTTLQRWPSRSAFACCGLEEENRETKTCARDAAHQSSSSSCGRVVRRKLRRVVKVMPATALLLHFLLLRAVAARACSCIRSHVNPTRQPHHTTRTATRAPPATCWPARAISRVSPAPFSRARSDGLQLLHGYDLITQAWRVLQANLGLGLAEPAERKFVLQNNLSALGEKATAAQIEHMWRVAELK